MLLDFALSFDRLCFCHHHHRHTVVSLSFTPQNIICVLLLTSDLWKKLYMIEALLSLLTFMKSLIRMLILRQGKWVLTANATIHWQNGYVSNQATNHYISFIYDGAFPLIAFIGSNYLYVLFIFLKQSFQSCL